MGHLGRVSAVLMLALCAAVLTTSSARADESGVMEYLKCNLCEVGDMRALV